MRLADALAGFARGWRDDLPDRWADALRTVEPDAASVAPDLTFDAAEPIFPARRAAPLPAARPDAHAFRAFDGLAPADVRCVLLGQDPYPRIARATGRSFEQGDLATWFQKPAVTTSLRVLLQKLAEVRTGDPSLSAAGGWAAMTAGMRAGTMDLGTPRGLFDHWQERGVLCLNAGLTLTRYAQGGAREQMAGHIPFWRPVVGHALRHVAARPGGPVVFLLLGAPAQRLALAAGIREAAGHRWGRGVDAVALPHPAATGFLAAANPFRAVDAALVRMGGEPIGW
ncbi:MAG: uracil-DNA glycosylase [Alphaproteobacteria bacterium]